MTDCVREHGNGRAAPAALLFSPIGRACTSTVLSAPTADVGADIQKPALYSKLAVNYPFAFIEHLSGCACVYSDCESPMRGLGMLKSIISFAAVAAVSLCCTQSSFAQAQMQGRTVGSPPLDSPAPGAPPSKPPSARQKRAASTAQGESQGLKGRDLTKFVKECMKRPS